MANESNRLSKISAVALLRISPRGDRLRIKPSRAAKIYISIPKRLFLSEAGDILIPLKDGIITESDFTGDLGWRMLGNVTGEENDERRLLFIKR